MCGRYSLALRPSQIQRMLREDNMPANDAPDDPADDEDENDGDGRGRDARYHGPRQSYNFAPGYNGVVYRADVPDWGAGPRSGRNEHDSVDANDTLPSSPEPGTRGASKDTEKQLQQRRIDDKIAHCKLQTMKWGLVPFWTKSNPGYGSMMKTINCRADSLAQGGGMWSSMKARKRCVVVAQGFYEWLKKDGGREKLPHYVKRKDGKLMCFAGLWDVVQYEGHNEKQYTYTIITTDSNKQLNFLHDRMPVILDNGSEKLQRWLDPKRYEWSKELQSLLVPYDGELEVYPVSQEVGKVGHNSPTFIIPVDSKENKSNIANFFTKGTTKKETQNEDPPSLDPTVKIEQPEIDITERGFEVDSQKEQQHVGIKREAQEEPTGQKPPKKLQSSTTATRARAQTMEKKENKHSVQKGVDKQRKISATSNNSTKNSPAKTAKTAKSAGTQKITRFFANSS